MIAANETEERRKQLVRAKDFQPSHQATTKNHWGRRRDDSSLRDRSKKETIWKSRGFPAFPQSNYMGSLGEV